MVEFSIVFAVVSVLFLFLATIIIGYGVVRDFIEDIRDGWLVNVWEPACLILMVAALLTMMIGFFVGAIALI